MTAVDRAEQDIAQGDYGSARRRLTGYLATKGYNREIVARLGRISHEMQDMYEAGRFWLTANVEGDDVEHAIVCFLKCAGKDPRQIVMQLPRAVRLKLLDGYPQVVRGRLRRLGLDDAIVQAAGVRPSEPVTTWGERAVLAGCLVVVLLIVVVLCVGLWQVGSWMFGRG